MHFNKKLFGKSHIIVLVYFLFIVVAHEIVSDISLFFSNSLSLPHYNNLIDTAYYIIISLFIVFLLYRSRKNVLMTAVVWLSYICLVELANATLLVVNAEKIHYIQYGVLALLLIPVFGVSTRTLAVAAVMGITDELYQYVVLNGSLPDRYIDFNDIILNMLGALGGILFYMAFFSPKDMKKDALPAGKFAALLFTVFAFSVVLFSILEYFINGTAELSRFPGQTEFSFDIFTFRDSGLLSRFHLLSLSEALLVFAIIMVIGELFTRQYYRSIDQSKRS